MSLESFYGGKQGVSPVIRARFKYVDTNDPAYLRAVEKHIPVEDSEIMEKCFENVNYEDVWYGQMAIIDTLNKRNPNNGKLFRRVLTRTESEAAIDGGTLHGEYIGRIIGPSEGYPKIRLGSFDSMKKQIGIENKSDQEGSIEYSFPTKDSEGNIVTVDTQDYEQVKPLELIADSNSQQLIPGYDKDKEDNPYETGIHYSWVNVRNNIAGDDQETYVYLGFQIPYTFFDFDIKEVNWDKDFDTNWLNEENYTGKFSENTLNRTLQPFYQKREILIPRGTQGNQVAYLRRAKFGDFRNLNRPGDAEKDILYPYSDLYEDNEGKYHIRDYFSSPWKPRTEDTQEIRYPLSFENGDNLTEDTSILVYTYYIYDKDYSDEYIKATIEDYNKNPYQNFYILQNEEYIKVNNFNIENIENYYIHYTRRKAVTCYVSKINDIKNINLNEDGTLTINYSSEGSVDLENKIKWISSVEMVSQDTSYAIRTIPATIKVNYNTGDSEKLGPITMIDGLTWTPINGKKVMQVHYTTDKSATYTPIASSSFKTVDEISIDDKTKEIKYHTEPSNTSVHQSFSPAVYLNSLEDVFLGIDGHIYIKHSSSEIRYNGTADPNKTEPCLPYYAKDYHIDENGRIWRRGGDLPDAIVEPGETEQEARLKWAWWLDLGLVKQTLNGVRFAAKLNTERYDAYYEELHPGDHFDWDSLIADDDRSRFIKKIESILTDPWTINDQNVSPYVDGNIFIYEQGYNTNLTNPKISENRIGQLVYFEEYAFYFDANSSEDGAKWKCAGSWDSSDASMQLRILEDQTYIPLDESPHEKGFTIITQENAEMIPSISQGKIGFNWDNIWAIEGE